MNTILKAILIILVGNLVYFLLTLGYYSIASFIAWDLKSFYPWFVSNWDESARVLYLCGTTFFTVAIAALIKEASSRNKVVGGESCLENSTM